MINRKYKLWYKIYRPLQENKAHVKDKWINMKKMMNM